MNLLWMGECENDHKIESEDDLIDGHCRVCWSKKRRPERRNFATLRKDPEFWYGSMK